jgi:hypothetical protein
MKRFIGFFLVLKVASKDRGTFETDLSTWVRGILAGVLHIREVTQTDLEARQWTTHMAGFGVLGECDA